MFAKIYVVVFFCLLTSGYIFQSLYLRDSLILYKTIMTDVQMNTHPTLSITNYRLTRYSENAQSLSQAVGDSLVFRANGQVELNGHLSYVEGQKQQKSQPSVDFSLEDHLYDLSSYTTHTCVLMPKAILYMNSLENLEHLSTGASNLFRFQKILLPDDVVAYSNELRVSGSLITYTQGLDGNGTLESNNRIDVFDPKGQFSGIGFIYALKEQSLVLKRAVSGHFLPKLPQVAIKKESLLDIPQNESSMAQQCHFF